MLSAHDLDPRSLIGTWELSRVIVDHLANEESTVVGRTEFSVEDDGRIKWSESGTLHRDGSDVEVSRVLYVEQREAGWFVTFEDGRAFHPWLPRAQVEHPCAPDTYVGMVRPIDDSCWSVEWRVTGPSKDYTMTSVLTGSKISGPCVDGRGQLDIAACR